MAGAPNSILTTVDHGIHRRRRNAYANYVSKQSIRSYDNVMQAAVNKLCLRLRENMKSGKPVNLLHATSTVTGDIVKSVSRLMEDAQTLLEGGPVTTSMVLALATYYILSDEHVLTTLTNELSTAIFDPAHLLPLVELEKLDYLTATTLETLRISHGVTHGLQRVSPDQSLRYHNWIIPVGPPVSMTLVHIHTNAEIFPNPHLFQPERSLPLEKKGRRLQKYLIAFSIGSQ